MTQLAINIFDLDRVAPEQRHKMFHGRLDLSAAVEVNGKADERGVVFSCPLIEAAIICDMVRSDDRKMGDYPTRVYIKRGSWSKVPENLVLTEHVDDRIQLSRGVFPEEAPPSPIVPLSQRRVF